MTEERREFKKRLGNNLRQLRLQHNYTQCELAIKIGVSLRTLKNWEQGKTLMHLKNLISIAKIFNVTFQSLTE